MVCVQDPTYPLGPCVGEPQGTENGGVYTGNWAADATVNRGVWDRKDNGLVQYIDYCIPACYNLIQNQHQLGAANKFRPENYTQYCPTVW